jgi:segregation and condensation protein B
MSEQVTVSTQNDSAQVNETTTSTELDVAQEVDTVLLKNILEAALLTSQEPLALAELKNLAEAVQGSKLVEELLNQLAQEYSTRGIELTQVASGWRFRARPEMQVYLNRLNPQKQPRYSRAVMETLAIIAYRQPVTRGDIEDIRGVQVASPILKTLEARNWIEVIGTRDVPGKPELFATTQQLLDDLNLRSLHELPELEEMGSLLEQEASEPGLSEQAIPEQISPEQTASDAA